MPDCRKAQPSPYVSKRAYDAPKNPRSEECQVDRMVASGHVTRLRDSVVKRTPPVHVLTRDNAYVPTVRRRTNTSNGDCDIDVLDFNDLVLQEDGL